jgi:hypothetical protein
MAWQAAALQKAQYECYIRKTFGAPLESLRSKHFVSLS